MDSGEEKVEIFDPKKHRAHVLTWATAVMKESLQYKVPPEVFLEISRQLAELDDGVCRVIGIEECAPIKKCFCGHDPHTDDCLTWPHLKLIVSDPNGKERRIHDLWMKPVTFKSTTKNQADETDHSQEDVVQNFLKAFSETERIDLVVVHLDAKGELMVCPLGEFVRDDFVFEHLTGRYLLGEFEGKLGEATFFDEDHRKGFITVMEGKIKQIRSMTDAVMLACKAFFREETRETKSIISILMDSVMERYKN